MTLSFMIKRKYLAQKHAQQKETGTFVERREDTPYWHRRIKWNAVGDAVFLCGRWSFRADILHISIAATPPGIEDVCKSKTCYELECKFPPSEMSLLGAFLMTTKKKEGDML